MTYQINTWLPDDLAADVKFLRRHLGIRIAAPSASCCGRRERERER